VLSAWLFSIFLAFIVLRLLVLNTIQ